jgi:hypothetical protein
LRLRDEPLLALVALVRLLSGVSHHVVVNIRDVVAADRTQSLRPFQFVNVPVVVVEAAGMLEHLLARFTGEPRVDSLFDGDAHVMLELISIFESFQTVVTLADAVFYGIGDVLGVNDLVSVEMLRIWEPLKAEAALVGQLVVRVSENVAVVICLDHETFTALFTLVWELFQMFHPVGVQVVQSFENALALVTLVFALFSMDVYVDAEFLYGKF